MATVNVSGKHGPPTAAEVAEAEKLIHDHTQKEKDKKLRSKMECLKHWARTQLAANDAEEVLNSRGEKRMGYLKEFLVRQLKEKGVLKTSSSIETHTDEKTDFTKYYEWNSEMLKQKMGADRGIALMALPRDHPNAIPWVPCPFTGSNEDPMRIWIVPIHMVVRANKDANTHELRAQGEADEHDVNKFGGDDSSGGGENETYRDQERGDFEGRTNRDSRQGPAPPPNHVSACICV